MTTAEQQELAVIVAQAAAAAALQAIEAIDARRGAEAQGDAKDDDGPAAPLRVVTSGYLEKKEPAAEADEARERAAQEIADMRLELEIGYGFAPDEHRRAAMGRLLEMLAAGDVAKVRELGHKVGLFRPETLAELPVPTTAQEATPEQRAAQEALKAERIAREVGDGQPRGEVLQIGDRSPMIGAWGKSLAPGASQRIAERRLE